LEYEAFGTVGSWLYLSRMDWLAVIQNRDGHIPVKDGAPNDSTGRFAARAAPFSGIRKTDTCLRTSQTTLGKRLL